jgi:hypothetical protein
MRRKAFENPGSMIARLVSLVAAGNVNSGQRAIRGSGPIPASRPGGLTPIVTSVRFLNLTEVDFQYAGCTRAWGGDQKPYRLTAVGTYLRRPRRDLQAPWGGASADNSP